MSKFTSSHVFRSFLCGFVCTFAASAFAQDIVDLSLPDGTAGIEEVVASLSAASQEEVLEFDDNNFETLTRGPLHEAFAEPIVADPTPGFVVFVEPPKPINELMPEFRPDAEEAIWISGYWGWDEQRDDFIWISGVFRVPPAGQRWVPGYWHQVTDGWQWVQGFWLEEVVDSITYLPAPPLSLENGPSSPSPGADYFYIPGNWTQVSNENVWNTGYWHPMQDDLVWVPSHMIWTPRGCVYVAGYWDQRLPLRGICFAPISVSRVTYSRPGWSLRPSVVLNSQILLQNLFVQPRYNHYLFGDYYGLPANHLHVLPAYVYHQMRGSYDPLISFYSAYNARQGQDMIRWYGNHYSDLSRNPEKRPARVWSPSIVNGNQSIGNGNQNTTVQNTTVSINGPLQLAYSLDQVNKFGSGLRVSPISEIARQNGLQRDREHKQLARDRERSELAERNTEVQGVQTFALPKSEITRFRGESNTKMGERPEAPRNTAPKSARNQPGTKNDLNALGKQLGKNLDARENASKRQNPLSRLENAVPSQPGKTAPQVGQRGEPIPSNLEGNREITRDNKPKSAAEQIGRGLVPNQPRTSDAPRRPDLPNRDEVNRNDPNRNPLNRNEPNRNELNRNEPKGNPLNRNPLNRNPLNRNEPNRNELNRNGLNGNPLNRNDPNRNEPNRNEINRNEPNRTDLNRNPLNRNDLNRNEPNRVDQDRMKEQSKRVDPPKIPLPGNRMNSPGETRIPPSTPAVNPSSSFKPPVFKEPKRPENPPENRTNKSSQPEQPSRPGKDKKDDRGNSAPKDQGKKPKDK